MYELVYGCKGSGTLSQAGAHLDLTISKVDRDIRLTSPYLSQSPFLSLFFSLSPFLSLSFSLPLLSSLSLTLLPLYLPVLPLVRCPFPICVVRIYTSIAIDIGIRSPAIESATLRSIDNDTVTILQDQYGHATEISTTASNSRVRAANKEGRFES